MRFFEILISAVVFILGFGWLLRLKWLGDRKFLAFAFLVFVAGLQIFVEGPRWQLYPLYAASVLLLVLLVSNFKKGRIVGGVFILLFGVFGVLLAVLLPVPRPFPVTGPFQVGTISYHLVDPERLEHYGPEPDMPREVMVQVWYPSELGAEGVLAPWVSGMRQAAPHLADYLDLPGFSLDHLALVESNSLENVPLEEMDGYYPVLVFSHGWSGFMEQNIYQVEELASQGYVVIAINHTYGAISTTFPDGRQAPRNPDALPSGVSDEEYDLASKLLVRQWAGDIQAVLDDLTLGGHSIAGADLGSQLDLFHVGVLGHSTGGGAGFEFCAVDPRCTAYLGMDAWLEPVTEHYLDDRNQFPVLLMHSEGWSTDGRHLENFALVDRLVAANTEPVVQIRIEGTMHMDFSVLPIITPIAEQLGFKGSLEGEKTLTIINAYTTEFFDQYFSEPNPMDLEGLESAYPAAVLINGQ